LKFVYGLVPATTTVATVSAATVATVSAATTTTAATATISAAAATAAFTLFHGTRFVNRQRTAIDFLTMELGDGCLRLFRRAHFHEAEATGATGHAIIDHLHPGDIARLGKEIGQVIFRHAKGQIAHIEFYAH